MVGAINSNKLLACLMRVKRAIPSKSYLPILQYFLFDFNKNRLWVSATNLEVSITETIKRDGIDIYKIAFCSAQLIKLLKALKNTQLIFHDDTIKCKQGSYKLDTMPVDDYPILPSISMQNKRSIPSKNLIEAIEKTTYACSKNRSALTGVLWEDSPGGTVIVATDDHQLSLNTLSERFSNFKQAIIPVAVLNLITPKIKSVDISFRKDFVVFKIENTHIVSRLISEAYPDYKKAIPKKSKDKLVVDRITLLSILKRALIFADNINHKVYFSVSPASLLIRVRDKTKEHIKCTYAMNAMEISMNVTLVINTLQHFDNENIVIEFHGSSKPIIFYDNDRDCRLGLVMPLKNE